jgi:hypothetical protein
VEDVFPVFYREPRLNPEPPYFAPFPRSAEGFATQIAQDVTISVTTMEQILASPNADAQLLSSPVAFTTVVDLSYYPAPGGGCVLNTRLAAIEWPTQPALPPGIALDQLTDALSHFLEPVVGATVPFNFTGELLPPSVTEISNAGMSVDTSLKFVAFRVDPFGGAPQPDAVWTNFYSGQIPDRLGGADWAMFVSGKMLESKLTFELDSALKRLRAPALRVNTVGSEYRSVAGVPQVDTTIYAFADLPGLPTQYLTPSVHTRFSVDQPSHRLVIEVLLDEIDALLELPGALLAELEFKLPTLWLVLEHAFGEELRELPGKLGEVDMPADGMECTALTNSHRRCTVQPPLPAMTGAVMDVRDCVGFDDGLAITGRLLTEAGHPLTGGLAPSIPIFEASDFAWTAPHVSCSQASNTLLDAVRRDPRGFASLYCEVVLEPNGTAPVFVCGVEVLNDRLEVFPKQAPGLRVERNLLPTKVIVEPSTPPRAYFEASYPLDLLIRTSAGIRLVRIPPPAAFTDRDGEFIVGTVRVQLEACPKLHGWFSGMGDGVFDLKWIDDPLGDPADELLAGHKWEIEIKGLASGGIVSLLDSGGHGLAETQQLADEGVVFSAVVPAEEGRELSLVLGGDTRESHELASTAMGEELRGVQIRQQPLWRASRLPLPDTCRSILPAGLWTPACLVAVMGDFAAVFDLSNPFRPSRLALWRCPDLNGACLWEGHLLLYSAHGCGVVGLDLTVIPLRSASATGPIHGAAPGRSLLHVLTDRGLEARTGSELQPTSTVLAEGLRSIRRIGDRLFAGGPSGLAVYDVSDEEHPHLEAIRTGVAVDELAVPTEGYGGSVLAIFPDRTAATVTVVNGELQDVATHASVPTLAYSERIGDVYAQVSDCRTRIDLAVVGAARLAVPASEGPATTVVRRRQG